MILQFAHSEEPVAKLERLKQNGSVQAYQEQFEVILNEVILLETHAISLFLNGLNDEIKAAVRCCEPRTLIETMRFAKLHEKTVNALNRNQSMLPPLNSSLEKGNEVADMGNIVLNERLAYAKIELKLKPKKDSKSGNSRNSYQGQVYCGDNTATTKVKGVIAHVVEGGADQDRNLAVEASHKAFDEGLTPNKDEVLIENGDDFVYFQVVVESQSEMDGEMISFEYIGIEKKISVSVIVKSTLLHILYHAGDNMMGIQKSKSVQHTSCNTQFMHKEFIILIEITTITQYEKQISRWVDENVSSHMGTQALMAKVYAISREGLPGSLFGFAATLEDKCCLRRGNLIDTKINKGLNCNFSCLSGV
ncbi:Retrotransposon-related protein [Quillaja saponaria]|uniref:Retrotransposon-related protein n=1 Tax=Quillaja saponaria TaxID=32244 RepID=A0AAD7Q7B9_QUISA|nr:Retrotransposon-related protein [Quillaja saponaria]